jgi:cell division protein FtsL
MTDTVPQRPVPRAMNRRTTGEPSFEHGMRRAADVYTAVADASSDASADASADAPPIRRPTGLPLLLLVALGLVTAAGVVQVRARARVLGLGAEIAEMTGEHSKLLDDRRRLEAERAYLRHPDYIQSVAEARLHMVPAAPERTQTIRLLPDPRVVASTAKPGAAK